MPRLSRLAIALLFTIASLLTPAAAVLPARAAGNSGAEIAANPLVIQNEQIALSLDVSQGGITLLGIQDRVTGQQFLRGPNFLFEFAANNGTAYQSNNGVVLDRLITAPGSPTTTILAHAAHAALNFEVILSLAAGDSAVHLQMTVTNSSDKPVFLRMVYPKLFGLKTPGDVTRMMGAIPQEAGSVIPLHVAHPGTPIAAVRRNEQQEDIFLVGNDGAIWTWFENNNGAWSPGLRLTLPEQAPPRAAIAAVMRNAIQEDVFYIGNDGALWTIWQVDNGAWNGPVRLDSAAAPAGGHLAAVVRNDHQMDVFYAANDQKIWTSFEVNNEWQKALAISAAVTQPGAALSALMRNSSQEDLFVVDNNGAIQTYWQSNDSAWFGPAALSGQNFALAGAPTAVVKRNAHQEDLFVTGNDGAIWTTFEVDDNAWAMPIALTGANAAQPGLAAVVRNDHQEDLFFSTPSGVLSTVFESHDSAWSTPIALSGAGFVPYGGELAALMRNGSQEDLFVVNSEANPATTFQVDDSAWAAPVAFDITPIGMPFDIDVGLPTTLNSMEVASIYDADGGGGLFFADLDGDLDRGIAPIQFTLSALELDGFWTTWLEPHSAQKLPTLAIGVFHSGDWHHAVDAYVAAHRPFWRVAPTPAWLRDQGAIYSYSGGGAGGIYLQLPGPDLKTDIGDFSHLPDLLDEAQALGTNVVYVWDYWQGADDGVGPPYFNKGDYIIRSDMGGEDAFRAGIDAIHAKGGRVIVYVEPFIIYEHSRLAAQHADWAGHDPLGKLYRQYPDNYSMVAPFVPWQDQVVSIAQHLVGDDHVDGIFLDSWGWQMNWPMLAPAEGIQYTSLQYSRGVLQLTDRVRAAIQAIKSDAVVMSETDAGPIGLHDHGGISADFAWKRATNQGRLLASPVRYGIPEVNFTTNGLDLNELQQVYAAGHNLALCCNKAGEKNFIKDNAPYIKQLVQLRQRYKDALIYGRQSFQPASGVNAVAAYVYDGKSNEVLTVVNSSYGQAYSGQLALGAAYANSVWQDLLGAESYTADGNGNLALQVAPAGLRVLRRPAYLGGPISDPLPVRANNAFLLKSNFSAGSVFTDTWMIRSGLWQQSGGHLEGRTAKADSPALLTYDIWSAADFVYTTTITLSAAGSSAGVTFRLNDAASQGYEVLLAPSAKQLQLLRLPDRQLAAVPLTVALNHAYSLAVFAAGNNLTVTLDGKDRIHLVDDGPISGRLGLVVDAGVAQFGGATATRGAPVVVAPEKVELHLPLVRAGSK